MHTHILPAILQASENIISIEIPICLLCCCNFINPFICFFLKFFIPIGFDGIGHCFECLEHIRVIVKYTLMLFAFISCCFFEVSDTPCFFFSLINTSLQCFCGNFINLWFPESIVDNYIRKTNGIYFNVILLCTCLKR